MKNRSMPKTEKNVPPILLESEVKKLIAWLKESLLHAMSLGNHELYHSNVWAWLVNRDARFATVFFPELKGKSVIVKREEKNRDITIRPSGNPADLYVIENKFKSLPVLDQLAKYVKSCGKNEQFCRGIVIGITEPKWPKTTIVGPNKGQWSFVPFQEIITRISSRSNDLASKNITTLLSMYCKSTENALSLLLQIIDHYHDKLPDPGQKWDDLHAVRLKDVFFKISAQRFKCWLEEDKEFLQLKNRFSMRGLELSLSNEFSNGSWIFNAKIRKGENGVSSVPDKDRPWFGLQVQGRQFRRCACRFKLPKKRRGRRTKFDQLFEKFRDLDWFEKSMRSGWRANARSVSQRDKRKMYGQYAPCFVYQYVDLNDFSWLNLKKEILRHLNLALQIKNPF